MDRSAPHTLAPWGGGASRERLREARAALPAAGGAAEGDLRWAMGDGRCMTMAACLPRDKLPAGGGMRSAR